MELWQQGLIQPAIGKTYRLEEAPTALRDLANRAAVGKSVLAIS